MIKLTLNPDKESKVYKLDKELIVIGHADGKQVDIPLASDSIQPRHVVIEEQNDRFIITNAANDPFTSVNGLPFGKKALKNFDRIEIGDFQLQFEFIEEDQVAAEPKKNEEEAAIDIDHLLQEVEGLDFNRKTESQEPSVDPVTTQETVPQKNRQSAEHPSGNEEEEEDEEEESPSSRKYYLQDFDDESDQWSAEDQTSEAHPVQGKSGLADSWKMLAGLLFAIIALSTVICSGVYFRASGKNSQEEKKIAAGIADISMAMTHARLNHITPMKQNWADPNFIRNNLSRVLSPNLHTQAQIDSEGQFTRYPYLLRVYTSRNMDQFIVIAQPAPNLMQWLVNKKTIVVDSTTMEMRKITDLKAINRLLANPNPLEGNNGDEIHRLIQEGSLMSLNSLAGHKNHWGFSPPKALGFIRPGAENFIYNAPRYYPFGEELLRKAIELYQNPSSPSDVAIIQDEMEEISNFNDIVLYTSDGLQMAVEAQKALSTFSPNSKFLVAYVKFNPRGFVASSHLLMNEERGEIAFLQSPRTQLASFLGKANTNDSDSDLLSLDPEEDNMFAIDKSLSEEIDANHPLYLQLKAVYTDRKRALKSINRQMVELLNQQNSELKPQFRENFESLFNQYAVTDKQHQHKIINELGKLYQEYVDMPLEEFIKFVERAKLTSFANATLDEQKNSLGDGMLTQDEIEAQFQLILGSESIHELEHVVTETAHVLSLEKLPDPEKLIFYQDQMHHFTLSKLGSLLLSSDSPYTVEPLEERDRDTLVHILENAWISDPHEFDYFITEFDNVVQTAEPSN